MSYSVTYDAEAGLIALRIQGRIDQPVERQLAPEVARIAKQHNCFLLLNDAREATVGLSIMDLYDLPKLISEILSQSGIQVHRFKRAIVVSSDMDDFTFFETVTRISGQNVMLFRDMDEARKWLSGK